VDGGDRTVMILTPLQAVYTGAEQYASAYLNVSRTHAQSSHELEVRWRDLAAELEHQGLPAPARELVAERVLSPTGMGGELGRAVVVADSEIVLDQIQPGPTSGDYAAVGRLPHLMPLLRARADQTSYLLVTVDHAGADIVYVDRVAEPSDRLTSEGGHDVLHKVPGGGWSQRRYQSRVEDSWERNATQVANDLDAAVAKDAPEVVFLAGERSARSYVHQHASGRVAPLLVDLATGGRAEGTSEEAVHEEIAVKLAHHRANQVEQVTDELSTRLGADKAATQGFQGVVEALRAGSVETALLADRPESTLRLVAGPDALQLGRTPDDLAALGATDLFDDRADEVMLRALVAQDAELVLVDPPAVQLRDGIGALLRYDSRPVTPGTG
jgi:hypothetical protein